ncbi:MAG TPA: hydroxysqualene dehydroxylase HpnE [Mycobacteriales bacterium]|nr:hydroxysqualene dehydroxylase HpnE [Mycobacteriales bacterium]
MRTPKVAVIGGGLAGITSALRLADAGCAVVLLEAKPRLGGLTASFRRGDLAIDTGQHVFLRCCTSYRALLDRLHATSMTELQDRLDVAVVRASDGRRGRLSRSNLPVLAGLPLHLGRSLASYAVMPPTARLAAVRAALALRAVDPADPATDDRSFGSWLAAHGQPPEAIDALWDLVGVATLNARSDDASLALAATVFQLGLLTESGAGDIGWASAPLQDVHGESAMRELAAAGVEIRLRTKVTSLEAAPEGWLVHTGDGSEPAAAVVVAAEPPQAERMLPGDALDLPAGWSDQLGSTPIVNAHAVFDRTVMTEPFLACVGSPLQWLFDRTRPSGLSEGQYLAASVSAADDIAGRSVAELRSWLLAEIERVLPAAGGADLVDFFVTREPHATFRQAPGSGRWRPQTATRYDGLVMAGAHTATGWPATMEGAVRSGDAAAAQILATLHRPAHEGVAA